MRDRTTCPDSCRYQNGFRQLRTGGAGIVRGLAMQGDAIRALRCQRRCHCNDLLLLHGKRAFGEGSIIECAEALHSICFCKRASLSVSQTTGLNDCLDGRGALDAIKATASRCAAQFRLDALGASYRAVCV